MAGIFDASWMGLLVRGFTALFALGLFIIAYEAYRRKHKPLLMFVAGAFLAYMIRDLIRFSELISPVPTDSLLQSLADILDLFTLLLIFFAVVKE